MKFFGRTKGGVLLFAVLYVLLLPTCAIKTEVKKVSLDELRGNLKYENVIFKEFDALADTSSNPHALELCQISAINYLSQTGLFKRVEKESSRSYKEPSILVEGTLTEMRIVSTGLRLFTGIFSGRSYMRMRVRLIDFETSSVIATEELEGAPASMASAYSFGHSDRHLPEHMGILVGQYILGYVGKK